MSECKRVYERSYHANLNPGDKCEIVRLDQGSKIVHGSDWKSYSKGPFIPATLLSHGDRTIGNTHYGQETPNATVRLDTGGELTQVDFQKGRTSFWFVMKGAEPIDCGTINKKKRKLPPPIIVDDDDEITVNDDEHKDEHNDKKKYQKIKPSLLNLASLEYSAPNLRVANMAQENGEDMMRRTWAADDSTDLRNYTNGLENLGDNEAYDAANAWRWTKGGRTKKRRNTRQRTRKYKSKRKQQIRKKTCIKRK